MVNLDLIDEDFCVFSKKGDIDLFCRDINAVARKIIMLGHGEHIIVKSRPGQIQIKFNNVMYDLHAPDKSVWKKKTIREKIWRRLRRLLHIRQNISN
jgi:hypothetical protein